MRRVAIRGDIELIQTCSQDKPCYSKAVGHCQISSLYPSLLPEANSLLNGPRKLFAQLLKRLVRWKIQAVETSGGS